MAALDFLSLPKEVRQIIYNFLDQKNADKMRTVSQTICNEIDALFHFTVDLHNGDPEAPWILQRKIKNCRVVKLLQPSETTFRYPHLVKTLSFLCQPPEDYDHTFTPKEIIKSMIESVSPTVQQLKIALNGQLMTQEFTIGCAFQLDELSVLQISVDVAPDFTRLYNQSYNSQNLFTGLTTNNICPKLRKIEVSLSVPPCRNGKNYWLLGSVVRLLCNQRDGGIKILHISYVKNSVNNESNPLFLKDIDELKLNEFSRITQLKDVMLHRLPFAYKDCWWKLLSNQKELEILVLEFVETKLNGTLLKVILLNNYASLVSITIIGFESVYDVDGEDHVFDFANLQTVCNLKFLNLECSNEITFTADLNNVHQLPKMLKQLRLYNFKIATTDLLQLELTNNIQLRSLELLYCGYELEFGVNGVVLENLMSINSLMSLTINQFNMWDNFEEIDFMLYCLDQSISIEGEMPDARLDILRQASEMMWHNV